MGNLTKYVFRAEASEHIGLKESYVSQNVMGWLGVDQDGRTIMASSKETIEKAVDLLCFLLTISNISLCHWVLKPFILSPSK
jgi:hypothetical protein